MKIFIPTKIIEDLSWADFGRFVYHRELKGVNLGQILEEKLKFRWTRRTLIFLSFSLLLEAFLAFSYLNQPASYKEDLN